MPAGHAPISAALSTRTHSALILERGPAARAENRPLPLVLPKLPAGFLHEETFVVDDYTKDPVSPGLQALSSTSVEVQGPAKGLAATLMAGGVSAWPSFQWNQPHRAEA